MERKIAVITGCSSGIGKYTAIEIARQDFELVMLVRDSEKSRLAFEEIKTASGSNAVKMIYVDFASFESIRAASNQLKKENTKIDLLINNAGLYATDFKTSVDGFELTFAVNYLAPVLLSKLLLPLLEASEKVRIVNVSSALYKGGQTDLSKIQTEEKYSGSKAYADSKLLLVCFTKELARQLSGKNITVNCLHPGVIATDVFREIPKWVNAIFQLLLKSPEKGAIPTIELATSPAHENTTGQYFHEKKRRKTIETVNDDALLKEIWNKSKEIIGV